MVAGLNVQSVLRLIGFVSGDFEELVALFLGEESADLPDRLP